MSTAALFAALSQFDELVRPIISYVQLYSLPPPYLLTHVPLCRTYLVGGTPQSVLASHCIRAVVSPDDDDEEPQSSNIFQRLGLLKQVAQKATESAGNERPSIARPAREARDALKAMAE